MARKRGGHGGNRTPRNPAPVSGVGAASARTDGGAGQPIRAPKDQPYGERQATVAAQQAAPLAAGDGSNVPTGRPQPQNGPAPAGGPPMGGGIGGPTTRPNEPITTGTIGASGQQPLDPDMLLRVIYSKRPTPYLARLLRG